jgi:transposase-like protein
MTFRKCEHGTAREFEYLGKRRIQRWRRTSCNPSFCEPQPVSPLGTMRTEMDAAVRAVQCLLEGCAIRATERLTGINRNTIMRLFVLAGERSERLLDTRMRELPCRRTQCDEIWTFVTKKAKNVRRDDPAEFGDQWIFVALDADTKLIPSFLVGKRFSQNTQKFMLDLRRRIGDHRVQLTTDAYIFYRKAVEESFAGNADSAQLTKLFGDYGQHGSERHSPPRITEVISKVRSGVPDPKHISTSFVERRT